MKNNLRYGRVLLKLSGELLGGPESGGISVGRLQSLSEEIVVVKAMGVQMGIVIGGGNILRGASASNEGMDRVSADYMGMLATVINALALQNALERAGVDTRVMTAIKMEQLAEPYIRRRAIQHIKKDRVIILAGGTGNPYFSTDTAAALRAIEIEADAVLKGTKVDGVYEMDPVKDPSARRFEALSYIDVLKKGLRVMDATAISLCMENSLPIVVFDLNGSQNIKKILQGENVGTIVS